MEYNRFVAIKRERYERGTITERITLRQGTFVMQNYMTDIDTGFKYIKFDTEKCIEEEYTHKNYLLFF